MNTELPDPPVQSVARDATVENVIADVSGPDLSPVVELSRQVAALVASLSPSREQPWNTSWVDLDPVAGGQFVVETHRLSLGAQVRVGAVTVDATVAGTAEVFIGDPDAGLLVAAFPVPVGGAVQDFSNLLFAETDYLTIIVVGAAGSPIRVGVSGSQSWTR